MSCYDVAISYHVGSCCWPTPCQKTSAAEASRDAIDLERDGSKCPLAKLLASWNSEKGHEERSFQRHIPRMTLVRISKSWVGYPRLPTNIGLNIFRNIQTIISNLELVVPMCIEVWRHFRPSMVVVPHVVPSYSCHCRQTQYVGYFPPSTYPRNIQTN